MSAKEVLASIQPRLFRRLAAARYISASPNYFDRMVKDGLMPRPKLLGSVKAWDRVELDAAVETLPVDGEEPEDTWAGV